MKRIITAVVCAVIMNTCNAQTKAYPSEEGQINSDGTINTSSITIDVGTGSAGKNAEFAFTLPELPEGKQFATAQFSVRVARYSTMSVDADLYGIEYRTTNSISAADYYKGTSDPSDKATLIQQSFCITSFSTTEGRKTSTNDIICADFLNDQYEKSLADRNAGETISIFFRVNPVATGSTYKYYRCKATEASSNTYYWPYILYTTKDAEIPVEKKGTIISIQ